ncbi:MAG: response regulator transcription factor, partial [Phaeodactylibacter sp.]|nr:response regulator transcription factor [Phaeodactylibacter sp.]
QTYIDQMPELNLVKRCNNALEANEILKKESIDLMFLDIQMPQLTGIDFLKTLTNPPIVIFTTAYPNYALEGFELDALDYLLKPISLDRFMKATNKAIDQINLKRGVASQRSAGSAAAPQEEEDDFIFVKADKKLVKIKFNEVLYIEGLKDYVIIRLDKSRVITLQTMKSLEEKLPTHLFQRIHRSYIVSLDRINAIVGNMVEVLEKGTAKHLPIGKNYRDDLLAIVNKNRL